MIIRIVKMTFRDENIHDFISAFESKRNQISSFEGCLGVELLQDIKRGNTFFTYSTWKDESYLEKYRQSELFNSTWAEVKKWFSHKARGVEFGENLKTSSYFTPRYYDFVHKGSRKESRG